MKPEQKNTPKGITITPVDSYRSDDEIVLVNPGEREFMYSGRGEQGAYLVTLGAYGCTRLLIWARSFDDAIEEAAEWCADHAPGLLADEAVEEAYRERLAELIADDPTYHSADNDETIERAHEEATQDTIAYDHGHYFHSWEVNGIGPLSRESILRETGREEDADILRTCARMPRDQLSIRRSGEFARTYRTNRGAA